MTSLAEIFEVAGPAYLERFGEKMLPSHLRAMRDIVNCRTYWLGGQLFSCDSCGHEHSVYHSCRNRHCPQCQGSHAEQWLEKQRSLLLPTEYLLGTCTLPEEIRSVARSNQRVVYSILIRAAAKAVLDVINDPDYIGGRSAVMAILHTWTRALLYHLHIHLVFPAGGLTDDGQAWKDPKKRSFPVPGFAVAKRFRIRVGEAFKKAGLYDQVPEHVWNGSKRWVANIKKVGSGEKALLYLSRYVFRVAISNDRIERFDGKRVVFRWTDSKTGQTKRADLDVFEFISRFLQHVLPRGFVKVRYYGLWAPACRKQLQIASDLLNQRLDAIGRKKTPTVEGDEVQTRPKYDHCPKCGAEYLNKPLQLQRPRGPP